MPMHISMKLLMLVLVVSFVGCSGATKKIQEDPATKPRKEIEATDKTAATDPEASKALACLGDPKATGFGPIDWPADKASLRWGFGVTSLEGFVTTKAMPVEVCGVDGELQWLMAATCPDGTSPFHDKASAHSSRVGSVGSGGRCGMIIDLYEIPCPAGTFSVYMDMYACGPGEAF